MNREKEMIEHNIELSRYLFEHPEIEKEIPAGADIILLPVNDKELKEFNIKLAKDIELKGGKAVYIEIKSIRPKTLSSIEDIELILT